MKRAALLAALIGAVFALVSLRDPPERLNPEISVYVHPPTPTREDDDEPAPPDEEDVVLPASLPATLPAACVPDTSAHCSAGVLMAFDSCEQRGEVLDDCSGYGCVDDACLRPKPGPVCPAGLSEMGRCADNTLEYCRAGMVARVECGARTCGLGRDGEAACLPPAPKLCAQMPAAGRCEGNVASICQGGKLRVHKCDLGSHCSLEGGAHCEWTVRYRTQWEATNGCSLCSCTSMGPPGAEACDGFDNDGDGQADNGASCQAIEIRAVVVRDRYGQPSASQAQITDELQAVNTVFNAPGHDTGLRFTLGETVTLDRPSWISADDTTIEEALADPALHSGPFRVPVLFTQSLESGGKQHPGVSTLPNGTCADLQWDKRSDANGLIIVGHRRWDTTLAHELGHYFGLCHTHQPTLAADVVRHVTEAASLRCADCQRTGDGICDTPNDPGTSVCTSDAACNGRCVNGETPDVGNVMSYYAVCRNHFSNEQTTQLHRYLARRSAWSACARDPSSCACSPVVPCPIGMMMRCDPQSWTCVPE